MFKLLLAQTCTAAAQTTTDLTGLEKTTSLIVLLLIIIAILTIMIFHRQRKIAKNQIDLAAMINQLLDKD